MAKYTWISTWFFISAFVIAWDAGYCLSRPRSMVGGDLHWIWKPYALYQDIDYVYGIPALESGDGFPTAQSVMNLLETALNLVFVYKTTISPSPIAPLVGIVSATATFWKTVLYISQEYYCNWCSIGHNDARTLIFLWTLPNGIWIVVPALIVYVLWGDIAQSLYVADKVTSRKANGKTQKIQ